MIEKIEIKNLTVFENLEINTNAPINVFIGENGVGKTQLLKFLYMIIVAKSGPEEKDYLKSFFNISPKNGSEYRSLINSNTSESEEITVITTELDGITIKDTTTFKEGKFLSFTASLNTQEKLEYILQVLIDYDNSVGLLSQTKTPDFLAVKALRNKTTFIPAKEMLTHAKGLVEMKKKHGQNMPFDRTHLDIIEKAREWSLAEVPEIAKKILPKLEQIMGGKVIFEDEEFFIQKNDGNKIPFKLEAEGVKKIGLVWQLLMTDNICDGSILIWDEPEANINPKLVPTLAEIFLELTNHNVQIFVSTHDYFLAKYLEVLAPEKNKVAFHSLYKTPEGVKCETNTTFSNLAHNDIIDERVRLYDAELEKEFSS